MSRLANLHHANYLTSAAISRAAKAWARATKDVKPLWWHLMSNYIRHQKNIELKIDAEELRRV